MKFTTSYLLEYFLEEGFFETWFTGADKDAAENAKMRLKAGFDSEFEKRKALDTLDDAIDKSNRVFTEATFTDWLATLGSSMISGGIIPLIRLVYRATKSGDNKSFREGLYKLRAEVDRAPVKN